jgi:hypothetical protein
MEQDDLNSKFDAIALAMQEAVKTKELHAASNVAERLGLVEKEGGKASTLWETSADGLTLSFRWRFYDQSAPFQILPDMNVLSLRIMRGEDVIRESEQRYED